jgi:hypothetical protein
LVSPGYDPDATPFGGNEHWIEIGEVTVTNRTASYAWNTMGVDPGTYYLNGCLYDTVTGKPVYSSLGSPIVIVAVPTFTMIGPTVGTFTCHGFFDA